MLHERDIEVFEGVLGKGHVLRDDTALLKYGRDETEDLFFPPEAVLRPAHVQQVQEIIKYCREKKIPVTPRAAGTGLSGGALPVRGGVVLSVERMNRILNLDEVNRVVVVEPGVVTYDLQKFVESRGLFYPPDPASRRICWIGGNVAENAGGPRALKYGVTGNYVMGLEVVLGTSEILITGGTLYKDVAGYDLTRLFVGSEGTLGVFTRIVLSLRIKPGASMTLLIPYPNEEAALSTVLGIFRAGFEPTALEFIGTEALEIACAKHPLPGGSKPAGALLLIQVDGRDEPEVLKDCERLGELCLGYGAVDVRVADSPTRENEVWEWRRNVAEAVKSISVYREEDTVVPRTRLHDLVKFVKRLSKKYGFTAACYGHAGDGNLHVNILKQGMEPDAWNRILNQGVEELFHKVVEWGGSITGEHGVGYVQRRWMHLARSSAYFELMRAMKKACDPDGILNPEKVFPD